jgi:hypothetical protein
MTLEVGSLLNERTMPAAAALSSSHDNNRPSRIASPTLSGKGVMPRALKRSAADPFMGEFMTVASPFGPLGAI